MINQIILGVLLLVTLVLIVMLYRFFMIIRSSAENDSAEEILPQGPVDGKE